MFPTWSDWQLTYTAKGTAKRRTKTVLSYLGLLGVVSALVHFRRSPGDLVRAKEFLKGLVRAALFRGVGILQTVEKRI